MSKILLLIGFSLLSLRLYAQESMLDIARDSSEVYSDSLLFRAYIDNYWGVDFNDPLGDNRPNFIFNYPRDNTFSTNLAVLEGIYSSKNYKITLGLQAGDFPGLNVPQRDDLLRLIYKSVIGVRITDRLWVDTGVKTSFIGAETPIGIYNLALTRSVLADNTPYFFSGIRLRYKLKNDFNVYLHMNNGWINNQQTIFNSGKSLGLQLAHEADDENYISAAVYVANERDISTLEESFYSDFHLRQVLTDRWTVLFTANLGSRYTELNDTFEEWGGIVAAARYKFSQRFSTTFRYQYFDDPRGVVIPARVPEGFIVHGISANIDFKVNHFTLLRVEGLQYLSPNEVFTRDGDVPTDNDFLLTVALQMYFPELYKAFL